MIDTVRVSKLSKRYGTHRALAGVDLTLEAGRPCAVLGPNGAGKSTLLGILSTLVRPTGGEVVYQSDGKSHPQDDTLRRHIGVLAHESFIYAQLTGRENLYFYGQLYAVDRLAERVEKLLDDVGLDEGARGRLAGGYSRGMTQRLALARALLHDPQVLLLDEPFTGLDRAGSAALGAALATARDAGRVLLVVTHDLESIAGVVDHVVVLRRGSLVHEARSGESDASDGGFSYGELKDIYHRYSD